MKWIKKGLVFKSEKKSEWMVSHASIPVVDKVDDSRIRIYFGTRDKKNRTTIAFIEVDLDNPTHLLYQHNKQVLPLGDLGCFDDSGVMPSWIVNDKSRKYLYYIGWNVGETVPYRNSIGLAISNDGGEKFERLFDGPVLDRIYLEPHFTSTPCVIIENDVWKMWYLSTVNWKIHHGRPEPYYHIKYAESLDGICWDRKGIICIDFKSYKEGGISRPCVMKKGDIYQMWYSYRDAFDYRENKKHSYRIGYAESEDGMKWTRKDEFAGIDVSETGWDSEMIEYPYVFDHKDKKYMFYNGNGFGESGIGYAILNEE